MGLGVLCSGKGSGVLVRKGSGAEPEGEPVWEGEWGSCPVRGVGLRGSLRGVGLRGPGSLEKLRSAAPSRGSGLQKLRSGAEGSQPPVGVRGGRRGT